MSAMFDLALKYALNDKPIFPCKPDKSPHVSQGFHAATGDIQQIEEWWGQWPNAMPGWPTGDAMNIFVKPR